MPRTYTKVNHLYPQFLALKEQGWTNKAIAAHFNLTIKQIKNLVARENRKRKLLEQGHTPRKKGRQPQIVDEVEELKMQVELLKNFLSEVGRR